jgi:uncharacterized membrane protein YebE (DUF533 family)
MDVEQLIGTMIEGTLRGGTKRSHGAHRFLRTGRQSFLNASTLLTVGGLVWGAIETMQQQRVGASPPPPPADRAGGTTPLPPRPGSATPPPLSTAAVPGSPEEGAAPSGIPEGGARLVRLMISAARADGELAEAERAVILEHARGVGAEGLVAAEIAQATPLARLVEGVSDFAQRQDLYVLAFGIVRADEGVSGSERIYLAQLAALLGLDRPTTERLERDAAARIERAAQEEK